MLFLSVCKHVIINSKSLLIVYDSLKMELKLWFKLSIFGATPWHKIAAFLGVLSGDMYMTSSYNYRQDSFNVFMFVG